jgi:hypothetical protein
MTDETQPPPDPETAARLARSKPYRDAARQAIAEAKLKVARQRQYEAPLTEQERAQ